MEKARAAMGVETQRVNARAAMGLKSSAWEGHNRRGLVRVCAPASPWHGLGVKINTNTHVGS